MKAKAFPHSSRIKSDVNWIIIQKDNTYVFFIKVPFYSTHLACCLVLSSLCCICAYYIRLVIGRLISIYFVAPLHKGFRYHHVISWVSTAVSPQTASGFQTQTRSRSRSRSPGRRRSRSRSPARSSRRSSSRAAAAVAAAAITESAPLSRRDPKMKDTLEVRLTPVVNGLADFYLSCCNPEPNRSWWTERELKWKSSSFSSIWGSKSNWTDKVYSIMTNRPSHREMKRATSYMQISNQTVVL